MRPAFSSAMISGIVAIDIPVVYAADLELDPIELRLQGPEQTQGVPAGRGEPRRRLGAAERAPVEFPAHVLIAGAGPHPQALVAGRDVGSSAITMPWVG